MIGVVGVCSWCGVVALKHLPILPQRLYWDFQKGEFVKTPVGIIQSKYKVTVVTNRLFMMGLQHSFPTNGRMQTLLSQESPISKKLRGGSLVAAISVLILMLLGLLLTVVLTLNHSVTDDSPGPVGSR